DLDKIPRGERALDLPDFRLHILIDRQRIGPELPLDAKHYSLFAMHEVPGSVLGIAVLDTAHVLQANRSAANVGHDDVIELAGGLNAAQGPHAQFRIALAHRSARDLDILLLDRVL